MQLDVPTTLIVSGVITAGLGLATLFYSLARKENRPLFWGAMACAGYSGCMFLAALRGRIADFYSIVLCNELLLFYLIAYFEAFRRLFSERPKERLLGPVLLMVQLAFFLWYTYYEPSFHARVLVISLCSGTICSCTLKLLLAKIKKTRRPVLVFTVVPFAILWLSALLNILLFLLGAQGVVPSFDSPTYAVFHIVYCVCAIWVTLSMLFIVSDRLQTQVIHLSLTDPLTGALNRRALESAANREMARSKRNGRPLSLIMSDLDQFKKVNDNYGHLAGDALLAHTVAVYQKNLRSQDVLARYGGDELVAVLPDTDLAKALNIAKRMKKACKADPLVFENQPIPSTASFGVVGYDAREDDYDTMIKHADEALYRAKEEGRDQVAVFRRPSRPQGFPAAGPDSQVAWIAE